MKTEANAKNSTIKLHPQRNPIFPTMTNSHLAMMKILFPALVNKDSRKKLKLKVNSLKISN
jgi:hypothetical protein